MGNRAATNWSNPSFRRAGASRWVRVGLCLAATGLGPGANLSAVPMKDMDITRGRPLQNVVLAVERRLHAAIGYEQGSPDESDMFVSGAVLGGRAKPYFLYPKMEHLHVHFVENETDPLHALRTAADAYDDGTPHHKFVIEQHGEMVLLFPAENSVSLRKITIPEESRTLDATAETIAQAMSQLLGQDVKIWTPPFFGSQLYRLGANDR